MKKNNDIIKMKKLIKELIKKRILSKNKRIRKKQLKRIFNLKKIKLLHMWISLFLMFSLIKIFYKSLKK